MSGAVSARRCAAACARRALHVADACASVSACGVDGVPSVWSVRPRRVIAVPAAARRRCRGVVSRFPSCGRSALRAACPSWCLSVSEMVSRRCAAART